MAAGRSPGVLANTATRRSIGVCDDGSIDAVLPVAAALSPDGSRGRAPKRTAHDDEHDVQSVLELCVVGSSNSFGA